MIHTHHRNLEYTGEKIKSRLKITAKLMNILEHSPPVHIALHGGVPEYTVPFFFFSLHFLPNIILYFLTSLKPVYSIIFERLKAA